MISPAEQKIIQIDITNACPHRCSNCTRFVGHHKKAFYMPMDQVVEAIDSLEHFPGMVGIMGGEPTLHPKFDKIVNYLRAVRPDEPPTEQRLAPVKNFGSYRNKFLGSLKHKRGLWTSLGRKYYQHYELIQDAFNYQCVNDHNHNGEHMALMITREELGVSDEEWLKYRDNCWVQTKWSASITPKGAFFCEVAAALDMLFDGPGGWKVEPNWWKRQPKDFGKQLEWCELCSACLPVPKRKAIEGVDDVSPFIAARLKEIGSKKPINVIDPTKYDLKNFRANQKAEPYLPAEGNAGRVARVNDTIKPKSVTAIVVCEGYDDYLAATLPYNVRQVDNIIVVTDPKDKATIDVCRKYAQKYRNITVIVTTRLHEGGAKFAKGKAINEALNSVGGLDWVLMMDADVILPPNFKGRIKNMVLNPGALYYTRRFGPEHIQEIPKFLDDLKMRVPFPKLFELYASKEVARVEGRKGNAVEYFPFGYFQLFNMRAKALQGRDPIYPENSKTAESDDKIFGFEVYPDTHIVPLPVPEFDVAHIPHGYFQENWEGRRSPRIEDVVASPKKFAPKAETFECIKDCMYQSKLYRVGDLLGPTKAMDVPKHFKRKEK